MKKLRIKYLYPARNLPYLAENKYTYIGKRIYFTLKKPIHIHTIATSHTLIMAHKNTSAATYCTYPP